MNGVRTGKAVDFPFRCTNAFHKGVSDKRRKNFPQIGESPFSADGRGYLSKCCRNSVFTEITKKLHRNFAFSGFPRSVFKRSLECHTIEYVRRSLYMVRAVVFRCYGDNHSAVRIFTFPVRITHTVDAGAFRFRGCVDNIAAGTHAE